MKVERHNIRVSELQVGMYVCDLDRPWLETPFLMQGFFIDSAKDIEELGKYCESVFIDVARAASESAKVVHTAASNDSTPTQAGNPRREGTVQHKPSLSIVNKTNAAVSKANDSKTHVSETNISKKAHLTKLLHGRQPRKYQDSVTWRVEVKTAKKAIEGLNIAITHLFEDLKQGNGLQLSKLKQAVSPLVSSVERNPDACIWLARLKNQDSYVYKHSVASSVWAVAFGRELGLPPQDLKSLALGAMLMDVGKLEIPNELLNKKGAISKEEMQTFRTHVLHSLAALKKSATQNRDIWDMVAYHHERYDGSGYPNRLRGSDIPLFAQIAGIVDSYDAMTSDRPYTRAVSPTSAIKYLYHARDKEFDAVLVEEFIQAVGLYPAGTLVQLSNGEVGVVVAEGRTRRLKPQVLILLDVEKNALNEIRIVDLMNSKNLFHGKPIEIQSSLEPTSYGIDPESIKFDPSTLSASNMSIG